MRAWNALIHVLRVHLAPVRWAVYRLQTERNDWRWIWQNYRHLAILENRPRSMVGGEAETVGGED